MATVIKGKGFKVTIKLDTLKAIADPKKIMNAKTQKDLGSKTLDAIKDRVAIGLSPVKGVRRYMAYASTRNGKGYPNTPDIQKKFPNKSTRPVNLKLSGEFLDALEHKKKSGGVEIGWFNPTRHIKNLIETHQQGLHPDVPRRQVLPTDEGNEFVSPIQRLIKNIVLRRISEIIKKGS